MNLRYLVIFSCFCGLTAGWAVTPTSKAPIDQLTEAARKGNTPIIIELLAQGVDINGVDRFNETALMNAADNNQLATITELLKNGAQINLVNKHGRTALFFAAMAGHSSVVEYLLRQGAQPDLADQDGETPLMMSARRGDLASAEILLQSGAKALAQSSYSSLLTYAAAGGNLKLFNLIFAHNPPLEYSGREPRTALLFAAAYNNHADIIRVLVANGANIEALDAQGNNALILAAKKGNLPGVEALVERGINVKHQNQSGENALSLVAQRGWKKISDYLISHGADPESIRFSVYREPHPELTPAQSWALATTAVRVLANGRSCDLLGFGPPELKDVSRATLKTWWSISNKKETLKTLEWLSAEGHRGGYDRERWEASLLNPLKKLSGQAPRTYPEGSYVGWDFCRYNFVVSTAYRAGYLTEPEAWEHLLKGARVLQTEFKSWSEMGESYLRGHKQWGGNPDSELQAVFDLLKNSTDSNNPWIKNPWNLELN